MDRVALLDAISAGVGSGEELARRFGVSRAMVRKAVQALRAEGLKISASGVYQLEDPAGFGPSTLAWRCGRAVHFRDTCGSTNRDARVLAATESQPLVVANHQTEGRGRLGRSWVAHPGENLLFSLVLRPQVAPTDAARCVLAWAAAMADCLDLLVKWPNDLVTPDGKKVGGVLAELESAVEPFHRGARVRFIVLGVGLNVNQRSFDGLPQATSLALHRGADDLDRAALMSDVLRAILRVDVRDPSLLQTWRRRSHTLGRRVRIGDVEGVATGLRADGALLVDDQPVLTGDVELIA